MIKTIMNFSMVSEVCVRTPVEASNDDFLNGYSCGCAHNVDVISAESSLGKQSSNSGHCNCVHFRANTIGKGINISILLSHVLYSKVD